MYLLNFILSLSVISDLANGRISNNLFVYGMLISQLWGIYEHSVMWSFSALLLSIAVAIILYPLFVIGCLGAGDIKLLMIFPNFFGYSIFKIIFLIFIVGAVIGSIKLLINRELISRICNAVCYFEEIIGRKEFKIYDKLGTDGNKCISSHQIHFSIPIFISSLMITGGIISL